MKEWEIWFASFPFEDKPQEFKNRPVIILNVDPLEVLSVKVTSHDLRSYDEYDTPIVHWQEAGLKCESIARVSKTMALSQGNFDFKIGDLHIDDKNSILNQYVKYITVKNANIRIDTEGQVV